MEENLVKMLGDQWSADALIGKAREAVTLYGLDLLAAVVILFIGWWAAKAARSLAHRAMTKIGLDPLIARFLENLIYYGLLTFTMLAALGRMGIQTASFIAVLGAMGLAVGLALQGSLSNFAAGVLLLIFRPIKAGDFIEGGGTSGTVQEVGLFACRLNTGDNKAVIVPNSALTGGNIVNYSANDTRRVDLVVGVSYGDDLKKVRALIESVLASDPRVLKTPEPTIGVLALADSSVNFAVRPWVRTADYWTVHFALLEAIKLRFDAEGVTIPFPQREVRLRETK